MSKERNERYPKDAAEYGERIAAATFLRHGPTEGVPAPTIGFTQPWLSSILAVAFERGVEYYKEASSGDANNETQSEAG